MEIFGIVLSVFWHVLFYIACAWYLFLAYLAVALERREEKLLRELPLLRWIAFAEVRTLGGPHEFLTRNALTGLLKGNFIETQHLGSESDEPFTPWRAERFEYRMTNRPPSPRRKWRVAAQRASGYDNTVPAIL